MDSIADCEVVAVMEQGTVVEIGSLEELEERQGSHFRRLLSHSEKSR